MKEKKQTHSNLEYNNKDTVKINIKINNNFDNKDGDNNNNITNQNINKQSFKALNEGIKYLVAMI